MVAPPPAWNRTHEPFAELISAEAIATRVAELGAQITAEYAPLSTHADVVVVGVLVLGIAGFYWKSGQDRRENSAAEKLAQANELFWRADYDRSRQLRQAKH